MIDIQFTSKDFDKIIGQCAVLPVFDQELPPIGKASLIDWRLNGRLSKILMDHFFSGKKLESMLIPAEGRVKSEFMMFIGLGDPQHLDHAVLNEWIELVVANLKKQAIKSFIISLSDIIPDQFEWRNNLRLLVSKLTDFKSLEKVFICESLSLIKEAKRRGMDFGAHVKVSFDLS